MHPELDSVDPRKLLQEDLQSRLGIGNQVRRRHAPDQICRRPLQRRFGVGRSARLNAAPINVIPKTNRETDSARMRHRDQPVQGLDIPLLLLGGDAYHLDFGKARHVKKVRITRCKKPTVLITKDNDQGIETILRQGVEIALPIGFIIKAALPVSPIHRKQ